MSTMYVMIGIPGSGKSTYIKEHLKDGEIVISRDKIRYSLLTPADSYFSKEQLVYKEFIKQIDEAIAANKTFYVDQTTIDTKARHKLFNHIKTRPDKVIGIYLDTPIKTALSRNEARKNREYVPPVVIGTMFRQLESPTLEEGFDDIWIIK